MTLKEIRLSKKITQSEAANILSVSLRSYKEYENNIEKNKTLKYSYLCEKLNAYNVLDVTSAAVLASKYDADTSLLVNFYVYESNSSGTGEIVDPRDYDISYEVIKYLSKAS